ncbi:hypothetical protein [Holospora curviuscula]|nr:hypothetical protein [Holospora curviuscula]
MGKQTVYRWNQCLEPNVVRSKLDPDAYQSERGVSAVGIFKTLRHLAVRHQKTLNHPKADLEKRSVLFQKRDQLKKQKLMNLDWRMIC